MSFPQAKWSYIIISVVLEYVMHQLFRPLMKVFVIRVLDSSSPYMNSKIFLIISPLEIVEASLHFWNNMRDRVDSDRISLFSGYCFFKNGFHPISHHPHKRCEKESRIIIIISLNLSIYFILINPIVWIIGILIPLLPLNSSICHDKSWESLQCTAQC